MSLVNLLYLINMYCDLSHDYCVILGMNFTYINLYIQDKTFLNSNVGFMFDKYLQKNILYRKIE